MTNKIQKRILPTDVKLIEADNNYGVDPSGNIYSMRHKKALKCSINNKGYAQIIFYPSKIHTLVSRVVWETFVAPIPEGLVVDHLNGIPLDNRLENLQVKTQMENTHNRKTSKGWTMGKNGRSFVARIRIAGKNKHIGVFDTKEAAHSAYLKAKADAGFYISQAEV